MCEETGLISDLTSFALRAVLRDLAAWRAQAPGLRVGINLSAHTMEDPSFPTAVEQLCELFVVPPSSLLFEITESTLARRERASTEFLQRLRAIGCELSIHDFGTGYSSFSYLRHIPVNEIKIDREFVRDLVARPQDRRIVSAIIELAHGLGLRALAEGVEDRATLDVQADSASTQSRVHLPVVHARPLPSAARELALPHRDDHRNEVDERDGCPMVAARRSSRLGTLTAPQHDRAASAARRGRAGGRPGPRPRSRPAEEQVHPRTALARQPQA